MLEFLFLFTYIYFCIHCLMFFFFLIEGQFSNGQEIAVL